MRHGQHTRDRRTSKHIDFGRIKNSTDDESNPNAEKRNQVTRSESIGIPQKKDKTFIP